VDAFKTGTDSLGASATGLAFKSALRKVENRSEAREFWEVALEQLHATLLAAWWKMSADAQAQAASVDSADLQVENGQRRPDGFSKRRGPQMARRSPRYKAICKTLVEIAESRPSTQEEVFKMLDGRHVVTPHAEPFMAARGWIAGFRQHPAAARAWLSKRWAELNLPRLPPGPKTRKK